MSDQIVSIGVLGASGYTGAELIRLLSQHPFARIKWMTADRNAGRQVADIFPHLGVLDLPKLQKVEDVDLAKADVIFCCLPHGHTQSVVKNLPEGIDIIDLSADFRLYDPKLYQQVYGLEHQALELQKKAVYGLSEHYREKIRQSSLIANPGCYTTTSQLPLIPPLKDNLIDPEAIIIDAKSGTSGAGRGLKENLLYCEVSDSFRAYGVITHRHSWEIEQTLSDFSVRPARVSFVPHLVPMNRGILATIYVKLNHGIKVADLDQSLHKAYEAEPFVHVLPSGSTPSTSHVRGTNHCLIAVHAGRTEDQAVILSVTDNLVKGASGQALHNMNIRLGMDEREGLKSSAYYP